MIATEPAKAPEPPRAFGVVLVEPIEALQLVLFDWRADDRCSWFLTWHWRGTPLPVWPWTLGSAEAN